MANKKKNIEYVELKYISGTKLMKDHKYNMLREYYDYLKLQLWGYEHACDELVILAAEDAGYHAVFTKTGFKIVNGETSFSVRFKNGIECSELLFRIKELLNKQINKHTIR